MKTASSQHPLDVADGGSDAMTPQRLLGIRQIEAPVLGDLFPPEEVGELLASSPEKGLFELERLGAAPEGAGKIGRIVTDAIRDARVAPETRARLLWRYNHVETYRDSALSGAKGTLPFGLLDSEAGRRQYCKMKRLDFETIRCSSPVFFKRIREISSFDWAKGKVETNAILRKAIDDDAPAELMISLGVIGRKLDARILTWLLCLHKSNILDWLMENDETAREWLDPRRMLFFACANWGRNTLADYLEEAEKASPGIVASCADAFGRNLLWYMLYNRCFRYGRDAEELLVRYGANPDAKTAWGVSWREMKLAREAENRAVALFVNGERLGEKRYATALPQGEGNVHHFRIILQCTGLAMEWTFPKFYFPVVHHASLQRKSYVGDKHDGDVIITFRQRSGGYIEDRRVFFRRGADRLFHLTESDRFRSKI